MSELTNEQKAINVLISAIDALLAKQNLNLSDLKLVTYAIDVLRPSTPSDEKGVDPKEQESVEEM
jgi:hypothetical protein